MTIISFAYKLADEVIFMNYKDYQQARDAAWRILIDCGVRELPVKVVKICREIGIAVFSYEKGRSIIERFNLLDHMDRTDGFTIFPDEPTIFYDGNMSNARCRFTIAHELGHLVLGHIQCGQVTAINRDPMPGDEPQETAANQFAARLLAPACVLWGMKLHNAEDIAKTCGISQQAATFRAQRMELLYQREQRFLRERGRSCFLMSPYERQVYARFKEYIDQRSG